MVRKKTLKPKQLDAIDQIVESWDMTTVHAPLHPDVLAFNNGAAGPSTSNSTPDNQFSSSSTTVENEEHIEHDILTIDSDNGNSLEEITEVPVTAETSFSGILKRRLNRNSDAKKVVFDIPDDDDSWDDEDYVLPTQRSSRRCVHHEDVLSNSDDDNDWLDGSMENDDGIEVLSETISKFHDDDIVLDYDGYEAARKAKERKKRGEIQYYGEFEKVLDECIFNIKVCRDDTQSSHCLFSEVSFVLYENIDPNIWKICDSFYLYICPDIDTSAIYFEWISESKASKKVKESSAEDDSVKGSSKRKRRKNTKTKRKAVKKEPTKKKTTKANSFQFYRISGFVNDALWRGFGTARNFHLKYKCFNQETKEVTVSVYLLETALRELSHPSEVVNSMVGISDTVCLLHNIDPPNYSGITQMKLDFELLFKHIKNHHKDRIYYHESVQHPALIPLLRPYQSLAVQWMLSKENLSSQFREEEELKMHCLFTEITAMDGTTLYYNKYGSYFSRSKPLEISPTPGGILADEMGLGKTVEVLACMLNNPAPLIEKPDYLEPFELEDNRKFLKRKKNSLEDVFTLHDKSYDARESSGSSTEDESEDSLPVPAKRTNKSNTISDSDEDYCPAAEENPKDRNKRKRTANLNYESDSKKMKNDSDVGQSEDSAAEEQTSVRKSRRKSVKKESFRYSEMDSLFTKNSDESSDEEYTVKPSRRTRAARKTSSDNELQSMTDVSAVLPKKVNNIEDDIVNNSGWSVIEKVIIEKCWDDKLISYKKEGSFKEFRKYLRMKKKDPCYLMTLREKLLHTYEQETALYSSAGYASTDHSKSFRKSFFKTKVEQSTYFECICGGNDGNKESAVQCNSCGLYQHARCVEYDTTDPYRGPYYCPHCWTQQKPLSSGATIIVAPSSITYQWVDEISKHVRHKAVKLLMYKGVAHQGYIQPRTLASFDLVVMSYETLSRELNYVDLPHSNSEQGRRFRHPKRFMALPTPLLSIEWWRCVLDEAQLVEATTARTALMALRLHAKHRWCVTGTPIQKSLDDLQGLLLFLGVDPWGNETWWNRIMYDSYCQGLTEPLHQLMAELMWRNSKKDVIHQIDLPPQTETIHWVQFSGVEEHFYRELHTQCSKDARTRLSKFSADTKLSHLDRKTLNMLLQPLLRLRQACNHPQVVKGAFTKLNNRPLSMVEVMERLVEKTKTQAEDAHRILVKARNGLAAVAIIRERWAEAVEHYRDVIASASEHSNHFKTDSLQRLHTLYNLNELLVAGHGGVSRAISDDTLADQANEIKQKYLLQYSVKVDETKQETEKNTSQVVELESKKVTDREWWLSALEAFDDDFVLEVRDELLSHYSRFEEKKCLLFHVLSKPQLKNMLQTHNKKMMKQREAMLKGVQELASIDTSILVETAVDCHLRPVEKTPKQCKICAIHILFEDYEKNLFFVNDLKKIRTTERALETADVKETAQVLLSKRVGNWGLSEMERILKYLSTRSLSKVSTEVHQDSQIHMQLLEAMKKEFKNFRIYWRAIFDHVSGLDEVNMATLRLRVKFPDEELPKTTKKKKTNEGEKLLDSIIDAPQYVLEEHEVESEELKFKSEKIVYENELRVKLGQLIYLQKLQKTDLELSGGENPEPCPICQSPFGETWAVLLCGHCFCKPCITAISANNLFGYKNGAVKCPMCRQPTMSRDISHVSTKAPPKEDREMEDNLKVVGSLSSKTEEVVRIMLRIKAEDPTAKVLVFSSWNEVLEVIADGLAQNGIPYRMLVKGNKFQANLASFRSRSEITALLLPILSGGNGLNLTEASHVFLVDPLLNPAAELQAVGRIHRMGQTKATVVHRFVVRGTIEHRMYRILGSLHSYPGKSKEVTAGDDNPVASTSTADAADVDQTDAADVDQTDAADQPDTADQEADINFAEEATMTVGHLKQLFSCMEENAVSDDTQSYPDESSSVVEAQSDVISQSSDTSEIVADVTSSPNVTKVVEKNDSKTNDTSSSESVESMVTDDIESVIPESSNEINGALENNTLPIACSEISNENHLKSTNEAVNLEENCDRIIINSQNVIDKSIDPKDLGDSVEINSNSLNTKESETFIIASQQSDVSRCASQSDSAAGLSQESDSAVGASSQESDSAGGASSQESDSAGGASQGSDSAGGASSQESDSAGGASQGSDSAGGASSQESDFAGGASQGSDSAGGASQESDSAVGASPQESDSAVGASPQESDSAVGASSQESDSAVGASSQESDSAVGASSQESDSAAVASSQESDSAVGASQGSDSAVGASSQESYSAVGASPQESDSAAVASSQESDSAASTSLEPKDCS